MTLKEGMVCHWEHFPEEVKIKLQSQEMGEEHSRQKEQHVKTIFSPFFQASLTAALGSFSGLTLS